MYFENALLENSERLLKASVSDFSFSLLLVLVHIVIMRMQNRISLSLRSLRRHS